MSITPAGDGRVVIEHTFDDGTVVRLAAILVPLKPHLCNRQPERWTHVNQVRVDTKIDVHVGTEQALQAKIMSMAQLEEPEDVR